MLWLVTPVHGREALTRIVFEQRARMLAELAGRGVEARQLVIGEDANLDTAREYGFDVLACRNPVGRRVNRGFEWAAREGATHLAYCGSDDWHLADYFAALPSPDRVRASRLQAFVSPEGDRLIGLRATAAVGGAPWVVPRELLEPCGFRPSDDDRANGVDSSIAESVLRPREKAYTREHGHQHRVRLRRAVLAAVFEFDDSEPLRMVDFKGGGEQITPWLRLLPKDDSRVTVDTSRPFEDLARHYPADLCEAMARFYADKEA